MFHLPLVVSLITALSPVPVAQAQTAPIPAPGVLSPSSAAPAPLPVPVEQHAVVEVVPAEHRLVLEQPAFGHKGTLVLHGITAGSIYGVHDQRSGLKGDQFSFNIGTRAGGFVSNHILISGLFDTDFSYVKDIYAVRVGVGPIVSVYAPMAPHWGFLPSLGAVYQFTRQHQKGAENADNHEIYVRLHLDAIVHLTQHLSATFGPFVNQTLYDHVKGQANLWETTYGISAGLLGWK